MKEKNKLYQISLNVQKISDRLIHFSSQESQSIRDLANELQELIILILNEKTS